MLIPDAFSRVVGDGASPTDQAGGSRSGDGVCERTTSRAGGNAVNRPGKTWPLAMTGVSSGLSVGAFLRFLDGVRVCNVGCGSSANGPSELGAEITGLVRRLPLPRFERGRGDGVLAGIEGCGFDVPLMVLSRKSTSSMASRSSGSSSTVGEKTGPPKVMGG